MAQVIGLPLLKGNSQVIISGKMRNNLPDVVFAGMAVGFHVNNEGVDINFVNLDDPASASFAGFVVETNECASTCTVIRAGEMIPLPRDVNVTNGEQLTIDTATGKIDPAGDLKVAGTIINDGTGLTFLNGNNGTQYPAGCLVNLSVSPVFAAAPAGGATTAKKAS